jgi:hypothetical protein
MIAISICKRTRQPVRCVLQSSSVLLLLLWQHTRKAERHSQRTHSGTEDSPSLFVSSPLSVAAPLVVSFYLCCPWYAACCFLLIPTAAAGGAQVRLRRSSCSRKERKKREQWQAENQTDIPDKRSSNSTHSIDRHG